MSWLAPRRQSATVAPAKRGPEAERFSSSAQVRVQWSTMTFHAPTVEMASASQPLRGAWPETPVRTRMWRRTTSWVRMSMPPRIRVMPGDGAVWPAMVRKGSVMSSVVSPMSITPATSNTTIRGPRVSIAARKEPGPAGLRLVTRTIAPPRPPAVCAAQPAAPGKAWRESRRGKRARGAESRDGTGASKSSRRPVLTGARNRIKTLMTPVTSSGNRKRRLRQTRREGEGERGGHPRPVHTFPSSHGLRRLFLAGFRHRCHKREAARCAFRLKLGERVPYARRVGRIGHDFEARHRAARSHPGRPARRRLLARLRGAAHAAQAERSLRPRRRRKRPRPPRPRATMRSSSPASAPR